MTNCEYDRGGKVCGWRLVHAHTRDWGRYASLPVRLTQIVRHYLPMIHREMPLLYEAKNPAIYMLMEMHESYAVATHEEHLIGLYVPNIMIDLRLGRKEKLRCGDLGQAVFVLAHEARHIYQALSGALRMKVEDENVFHEWNRKDWYMNATADTLGDKYHDLPWEKDADEFARSFTKKVGLKAD